MLMDWKADEYPYIIVGLPDALFTDVVCYEIESMIGRKYDLDHTRLNIVKTITKTLWVDCSDDFDSHLLLDRVVAVVIHIIMD